MMGFGMFGAMLFFLIALVVLVVLLVRAPAQSHATERTSASQAQPSPLEILEQRYARGEITQEQFLQMKKDLKQD
jgi:putative membrane protein